MTPTRKSDLILLLILFLSFYTTLSLNAQKQISGKSDPRRFNMRTTYEIGMPPDLYANLQFNDVNGNGILEAEENAELIIQLTNKGMGIAQGLKIYISEESNSDTAFNFKGETHINYIHPNESVDITFPLSAGFDIKTSEHNIKINVLEHFGYDMDPAILELTTLEYQAPDIVYSGYEVVDVGKGTYALKEDGQIQPGEWVKVKFSIQNVGQNVASNIRYSVVSKDQNVYIDSTYGHFDQMAINEVKSFWITVSPNKRVDPDQDLPLFLNIEIDQPTGSLKDQPVPLALNSIPPETEILHVTADLDKLQNQIARFEVTSNKFTAKIGRMINIRELAPSSTRRNDAVAVIFGIEEYDDFPPAPYAENDAEIIKEYFKTSFGIDQVVTYKSDQSKGFVFENVFDPEIGELQKAIIKGKTDVFVFYSGHGLPSKDGEKVYLVPSDGRRARLEERGYDLNDLYEDLNSLGAKSVTVILDACFSGASRYSEGIQTENLVSMKGIRIKPKLSKPWEDNPYFSVITSSGPDETSLAFDGSQTGLFTYFMCVGLQGSADLDNDNTITLGELHNFVKENVTNTSRKLSGIQTPEMHGNSDFILVEF